MANAARKQGLDSEHLQAFQPQRNLPDEIHGFTRDFRVDLTASARYLMALPLQSTHVATLEVPDPQKLIRFPARFDKGFNLDQTSLISRMVEVWGEVPVALIQKLDARHCQYGYIGLDDYTMYPLLRPGSFVQIESHATRTPAADWRTEFDRAIYFVELRDAYACG